jgi:Protein of unknown function (DUF3102)
MCAFRTTPRLDQRQRAVDQPTELTRSNSLIELAARIRAEHEAVGGALQHAVVAGELLIEARSKVTHGDWLPWLEANCEMSERTAQAYMRVARELAKLDPQKRNAVADLSYRDALNQLSGAARAVKNLPPERLDQVLAETQTNSMSTLLTAAKQVEREKRFPPLGSVPPALAPTPDRKISIARNPTQRQWLLAIGPNAAGLALKEHVKAARETESVVDLQDEHDELLEEAASLEAQAKQLREDAAYTRKLIDREIKAVVEREHGPAYHYTETFDFQADDATDAELATLSREQLIERLTAMRGGADGPLKETKRGYWGDMNLVQFAAQGPEPGPPSSWTGWGSGEWLDDLFGPRSPKDGGAS